MISKIGQLIFRQGWVRVQAENRRPPEILKFEILLQGDAISTLPVSPGTSAAELCVHQLSRSQTRKQRPSPCPKAAVRPLETAGQTGGAASLGGHWATTLRPGHPQVSQKSQVEGSAEPRLGPSSPCQDEGLRTGEQDRTGGGSQHPRSRG